MATSPLGPPVRRRMAAALAALAVSIGIGLGSTGGAQAAGEPEGIDVSHHQGAIDWAAVKGAGISFTVMKATEGTTFQDPNFGANYDGSAAAGLIRGAYHFAQPASSGGATQADYFADHGGGWSADGRTLPGMLDIEYNPSGATCYGLSQSAMVGWITDFLNEYHNRTSRWAIIYSTTDWWTTCTGNYAGFAANSPLWIARYSSSPGTLPAGWGTYTFWQYTSTGSVPGVSGNVDRNIFNGSPDRLLALANNTP